LSKNKMLCSLKINLTLLARTKSFPKIKGGI
jgi:hypothetical protein